MIRMLFTGYPLCQLHGSGLLSFQIIWCLTRLIITSKGNQKLYKIWHFDMNIDFRKHLETISKRNKRKTWIMTQRPYINNYLCMCVQFFCHLSLMDSLHQTLYIVVHVMPAFVWMVQCCCNSLISSVMGRHWVCTCICCCVLLSKKNEWMNFSKIVVLSKCCLYDILK